MRSALILCYNLHKLSTLLKEGLADPSAELVQALKKLLLGVATGVEIAKYLVRSFQPKT